MLTMTYRVVVLGNRYALKAEMLQAFVDPLRVKTENHITGVFDTTVVNMK